MVISLIFVALISLVVFFVFKKFGLATLLFLSCIAANIRVLGSLAGYVESAMHFGKPLFEGPGLNRMMGFGLAFVINTIVAWVVILICYSIYKHKKAK